MLVGVDITGGGEVFADEEVGAVAEGLGEGGLATPAADGGAVAVGQTSRMEMPRIVNRAGTA